jgi:hypothetical protein
MLRGRPPGASMAPDLTALAVVSGPAPGPSSPFGRHSPAVHHSIRANR